MIYRHCHSYFLRIVNIQTSLDAALQSILPTFRIFIGIPRGTNGKRNANSLYKRNGNGNVIFLNKGYEKGMHTQILKNHGNGKGMHMQNLKKWQDWDGNGNENLLSVMEIGK